MSASVGEDMNCSVPHAMTLWETMEASHKYESAHLAPSNCAVVKHISIFQLRLHCKIVETDYGLITGRGINSSTVCSSNHS